VVEEARRPRRSQTTTVPSQAKLATKMISPFATVGLYPRVVAA
jgi:hypothetical protein